MQWIKKITLSQWRMSSECVAVGCQRCFIKVTIRHAEVQVLYLHIKDLLRYWCEICHGVTRRFLTPSRSPSNRCLFRDTILNLVRTVMNVQVSYSPFCFFTVGIEIGVGNLFGRHWIQRLDRITWQIEKVEKLEVHFGFTKQTAV